MQVLYHLLRAALREAGLSPTIQSLLETLPPHSVFTCNNSLALVQNTKFFTIILYKD